MWLNKTADALNRVVCRISGGLYIVGVSVLAALMFLTASDVTLRYVFNRPIKGSFDLTEFMMVVVVVFGIAHCGVMRGHVRVELVVERLPQRIQAIIDSVTGFLGFGLFSFITWQCFVYLKILIDSGLVSNILDIPVSPFVGVVGLGSAVYTLMLLVNFLESLSQVAKR